MSASRSHPTLLLAGGGSGLLGRALLEEFSSDWTVRSVHRAPVPREARHGIELVHGDLTVLPDFDRLVDGVDAVVNVAWYRWGSERKFLALYEGLGRLLDAARRHDVPFLQVSVPTAPAHLETGIPYLTYKRRFDASVRASGLPYAVVRPTLMFAPGDVLLGVMLRSIRRYPFFPMFGDGNYRISPVAAADVAKLIRAFVVAPPNATVDVGGPVSYRYREVTDWMYRLCGKRPRYWNLSPGGGVRLARLAQSLGSSLLYAYEVEWLLSDTLALPPTPRVTWPMRRVEPYLRSEAELLTGRPVAGLAPIPVQP
jgi:uncharacterized protein YbjT (DUF2867 family)